tara:strand:- start:6293 stop:6865 length:573 start_codon:yes stop_codon:yes gene_type:complete
MPASLSVGGKRRSTKRRSTKKRQIKRCSSTRSNGRRARSSKRSNGRRKRSRGRRAHSGGGGFMQGLKNAVAGTDPCAALKDKPLPTKAMGMIDYGTNGVKLPGTYTGNMKQHIGKETGRICQAHGQGKWVSTDGKITLEGSWVKDDFKGVKPPATQRQEYRSGNTTYFWKNANGEECSKLGYGNSEPVCA